MRSTVAIVDSAKVARVGEVAVVIVVVIAVTDVLAMVVEETGETKTGEIVENMLGEVRVEGMVVATTPRAKTAIAIIIEDLDRKVVTTITIATIGLSLLLLLPLLVLVPVAHQRLPQPQPL